MVFNILKTEDDSGRSNSKGFFFPTESQHISADGRGGVPGVGCNTSERWGYSISVTCWQKPEIALNREVKELLAVPSQPCWMGPLRG